MRNKSVILTEQEIRRLMLFYATAENEILTEINKGLAKGNNVRYLQTMRANVGVVLDDLLDGSREWCEQAIPRIYVEGMRNADRAFRDRLAVGLVHQQAAHILAENTFARFEDVAQLVGRRTNDIYRALSLDAVRGSTMGYKTWKQTARKLRDDLLERGITGFVDKAGRQWNLNTYAEMVARTSTMEAHIEGTKNRLLERGHDLVKVSTHMDACDLCEPWQGEVLSLTGNTEGYYTLDEARDEGLFHPNCKHAFGLYVDMDKEIEKME